MMVIVTTTTMMITTTVSTKKKRRWKKKTMEKKKKKTMVMVVVVVVVMVVSGEGEEEVVTAHLHSIDLPRTSLSPHLLSPASCFQAPATRHTIIAIRNFAAISFPDFIITMIIVIFIVIFIMMIMAMVLVMTTSPKKKNKWQEGRGERLWTSEDGNDFVCLCDVRTEIYWGKHSRTKVLNKINIV